MNNFVVCIMNNFESERMHGLNEERALELLNNCKNKVIAVIGDVMLDRYFWGAVSRVSPEAPVPVVDVERETFHLGGAANVANNLKSLGLVPILCGSIGDDNPGQRFKEISKESGINTSGLYSNPDRPTTVKTRIIGNNQQIVRLDIENRSPIIEEGKNHIINILKKQEGLAGIIFEDYNKGTITKSLISELMPWAREKKIPVFVDPKYDNFFDFKNVSVFKPNRKEACNALGYELKNHDNVIRAGKELLERLECDNVLLTLGSDGMMLFESNGNISSVPTRARHVADVSGAGDTAIATLSAAIAGGAGVSEAAAMANYASGAVCERPGIVSIEIDDLLYSVRKNMNK